MLVVQCIPAFAAQLDQPYLERLADAVLIGEGITGRAELSLLITDDEGIRAVNRQYRRIDAATDVLSFSLMPGDDRFVTPSGQALQLGDIIISYQRCIAQAHDLDHSVRQELAELFVHGLLHILGYDHETTEDADAMARAADTYTEASGQQGHHTLTQPKEAQT